MKIAVTGHTKGIGKACVDRFTKNGHEVIGFSRSNGYDISVFEGKAKIRDESRECDVFINNAYSGRAQEHLFDLFWRDWKSYAKTIININSVVKYPQVKPLAPLYKKNKEDLEKASGDAVWDELTEPCSPIEGVKCRVLNINPGLVETEMAEPFTKQGFDSLDPDTVAECIEWALDWPQDVQIYDLTVFKTGEKLL